MPVIGSKLTPFQQHQKNWSKCQRCLLCETRRNVVLARGTVPCDILFVGEAPGASEDVLGKPFIGPAGKLLDEIIAKAIRQQQSQWAWEIAFTNIIACIPKDESNRDKLATPPKVAISACRERLEEFLELAEPQLIVCVGAIAAKHLPENTADTVISIIHPAAILRMTIAQQPLEIQRAIVTIEDAVEELVPF